MESRSQSHSLLTTDVCRLLLHPPTMPSCLPISIKTIHRQAGAGFSCRMPLACGWPMQVGTAVELALLSTSAVCRAINARIGLCWGKEAIGGRKMMAEVAVRPAVLWLGEGICLLENWSRKICQREKSGERRSTCAPAASVQHRQICFLCSWFLERIRYPERKGILWRKGASARSDGTHTHTHARNRLQIGTRVASQAKAS